MDQNRTEKLLAVRCLMGVAHEAGSTIVDGVHMRSWEETEMLLDCFQDDVLRYVRRLSDRGGSR